MKLNPCEDERSPSPVPVQGRAGWGQLGRMRFTAPAAAAKQGGMWQGAVLLERCCPPQNGCSLVNPVLNMLVNSRNQPGFCGIWHRCCGQQVQASSAAAGSPLACPSMQLALPLGRDGNHSSAHGLSEQLCPNSLGDSLTPCMEKAWHTVPSGKAKTARAARWLPHSPPFLCQARWGASWRRRLGPTRTLPWDQSRAGCKPPSRRCPFVPLHTVP